MCWARISTVKDVSWSYGSYLNIVYDIDPSLAKSRQLNLNEGQKCRRWMSRSDFGKKSRRHRETGKSVTGVGVGVGGRVGGGWSGNLGVLDVDGRPHHRIWHSERVWEALKGWCWRRYFRSRWHKITWCYELKKLIRSFTSKIAREIFCGSL